VTPVSVVEKKDIGDLFQSVFLYHPGKYSSTPEDLPQHRLQQLLVKLDSRARNHRYDQLPSLQINQPQINTRRHTYQQLMMRNRNATPPNMA
jgi:hypothetical protein